MAHDIETRDGEEKGVAQKPAFLWSYRILTAGFLVLGLLVCRAALQLTYYSPLGPAPGFFPFWAGALLVVFCAIVLVQSWRGPLNVEVDDFTSPPGSLLPIGVTVGAIAFFGLAIERLGFVPTMFVMLLALLTVYRCRLMPTGLLVALGGSFGVGYAFTHWLGVYLPPTVGGVLSFIRL